MYVNFILSKALIEGSEILWLLNSSPLINFKLSKRTSSCLRVMKIVLSMQVLDLRFQTFSNVKIQGKRL